MSKAKYIFLIIIPFLTFFYECKSGNSPEAVKTSIVQDSIPIDKPCIPDTNRTEEHLKLMGLVNVQDSIPEIIIDLKYSTTDNFLGIDFYGELENAFVQPECYLKLKNAYSILQKQKPGYTFIVFDAVRSTEAQQFMWDSIDVPLNIRHWYVANPQKGSIHNYGMALDIGIVDSVGNILDMGTKFDFFGELAYPEKTDYFLKTGELSQEQYTNRKLLMSVMQQAYFYVSKTEWWHYNASSLDYAKNKYKIFSYPLTIISE